MSELPSGATLRDLLIAAIKKTGTSRFRYVVTNPHWALGDATISFAANAFKTAPVTASDGTVTAGTGNDAFTVMFGVDGATARFADPAASGTIDVNVLNQPQLGRRDVHRAHGADRPADRRRLDHRPRARVRARRRRPRLARARRRRARRRC